MKKHLSLLVLLFLSVTASRAADATVTGATFPFVLPWDDASPGVTNMSALLPKPAGGRGFVISRNGHLFDGDKRFRIFGVNTAFGANFPTHEDAEKVAARMAKFGINCVRFHHMDWQAAPRGIWSADLKTLDPGQLDKLDYFIAQLKKNGVYADLNLHVSRTYPDMPTWVHAPGYYKGVDNFYPPMIAMQRDYARALLTHVNPYTKTAYVDEPAVALIEINNENGLTSEWWGGWMGTLDGMSGPCGVEFESLWNQWLKRKYPSQEALEKAWNKGQEPLGPETLKDPAFGNGVGKAWQLAQLGEARASVSRDDGGLRVSVSQMDDTNWHVQLSQGGIPFSKGKHYTIRFRARADAPRRINVNISQAHAPWNQLWSTNVPLTTEWKDFHFTFQPSSDEENGRVVFTNLAAAKGDCWIADASLRPGGVEGVQNGEKIGAVPFFKKADFGMRTIPAQRDWMNFLYDTESDYWTGMRKFLKEDLKAHSLVVGSATGFSPPSIQAKLDVVDVHAYWQHPHFPHKSWDQADWTVGNIAMAGVPDGGTLPGVAENHVEGKPYICTEYNEAAPNPHASEAFLLANAYAALQDMDGIFVFAYSHRQDDWNSRRICSFFDIDQHPTKLATLPASVAMFLRGDAAAAKKTVVFPVSRDAAIDAMLTRGPWWGAQVFGMKRMEPFRSGVRLDPDAKGPVAAPASGEPGADADAGKVTESDTGELVWDSSKGCFKANTPFNKVFAGKITGEPVKLGDVTLEPGKTMQDWAAVTLTAANRPDGSANPNDILITATGYAENTGMIWTNAEKNSVGKNWGTAPSLVEGIPVKITLPLKSPDSDGGKVEAWALDEKGQRKGRVKVTRIDSGVVIEIGPQYQTLWYEVVIPEKR